MDAEKLIKQTQETEEFIQRKAEEILEFVQFRKRVPEIERKKQILFIRQALWNVITWGMETATQ